MLDIYVINLIHRNDRKEIILSCFSKYKSINLIFIEAIKHSNGTIGCLMSHQKCIEIAKTNNLDKIIVIEDDCSPVDRFEENLHDILNFLDENNDKWDIFLGGTCNIEINNKNIQEVIPLKNKHLLSINNGSTTHFIIYNRSSYDFFLYYIPDGIAVDNIWWNKLRCLLVVPYIAFQRASSSDIVKDTYVDYTLKMQRRQRRLLEFISVFKNQK
jgi:GR25 family glycosyltransferase involved in LPS biosynthesis